MQTSRIVQADNVASGLAIRFRQASKILSSFVAILGLVVLYGWFFDLPALTTIQPTLTPMKFNTAVLFLCSGMALWMAGDDKHQRIRRILGLVVAIIAGLTLVEYAFEINLGIDQLVFHDVRTPVTAYPGRMSAATAICFLLLGLAVFFLGLRTALSLQRAGVALALSLSLVSLCSYLYGVKSLYSLTLFSTMAVHTAAGLIVASLAYFLARPNERMMSIAASNTNAGLLLRTLLPATVVLLIIMGWLMFAGQRVSLYEVEFGVALLVLGNIACLTLLTTLVARSLHHSEQEQQQTEKALKEDITERKRIERKLDENQKWVTGIIASATDAIISIDDEDRIFLFNAAAERMFGYHELDAIGRRIEWFIPQRSRPALEARIRESGETEATAARKNHPEYLWGLRASAEEFPIEASVSRWDAEGKKLFTIIIRDVAERMRSEAILRESEERFRLVANTTPVMIWMSGVDKLCIFFNQTWLEFTGRPLEAELGNGWAEGVHSEDLARCLKTYSKAFNRHESFQMEYRLRRRDGEYRWILDYGVPRVNIDGSFAGYIGSCIDITERKKAEEAIANLSGRLIQAQEEERSRIARELHDDINQRLALQALNLEGLKQELPTSAAGLRQKVDEQIKNIEDLGSNVQALSHRLHSSKLEHLGLARAAASFCKELSDRQGVEIDFHCEGIHKDLPADVALCLFRVLQEALQNAAKYSGSRQFQVSFNGEAGEIELTVRDSGLGFNLEEAMKGHGLGLTSMRERLKLVNGDLSIDSQPKSGTTIQARVPLMPRTKAAGAFG